MFDDFSAVRKATGSKGARVLQNADNPNEVIVITEWANMEQARQMAQSQELREAQQRAGVTGPPDVYFLDEVDNQPA